MEHHQDQEDTREHKLSPRTNLATTFADVWLVTDVALGRGSTLGSSGKFDSSGLHDGV